MGEANQFSCETENSQMTYNIQVELCRLNGIFQVYLWADIKPVNTKGNQPWTFIGRIDAEAKAPMLWPSDGKSWLIEKSLILGKIEG